MGSAVRSLLSLFVILLAATSAAEAGVPASEEKSEATSIVQEALQAEVDGDAPRRDVLLALALQQDPKHPAARWHSGHVQIDDGWLTIGEAERGAAKEGVVAEYCKLRDRYSGSLAGELSLARWCRKKGLEEREKLHWASSLYFDRNNREARTRLAVREFRGRLLTAQQIDTWKQARREYERALQEWNPRLDRWRREIEGSPSPYQTEAWQQLASVDDPQAVPSLEQMFRKADIELKLQIISALGNIEEQVATDVLVRLSLYSESSEIRQAAASQLSDRSWFGFVPSLLSRLEAPVECRYFVNTLGNGIYSEVRYSQEQPSAVVNMSGSVHAQFPIEIALDATDLGIQRAFARQQSKIAQEASRQSRQIASSLQAVQAKNARTGMFNERIYAALETATGQEIQPRPQACWQWWQDYNELQASEEKPEFEFRDDRYRRRVVRTCSCFLAGTLVWTETGPVAIEDVRRGDRVLSQDPDSGELAYRMVLDTTIRPPSPTLRIQVADESIEATLGHPLWVIGSGWRMAKELKVGDQLHGVEGGIAIDNIQPGPESEAYNLVVAETNTYFVGKHRLLVHDNMARRVTEIPVPGWAEENN